MARPESLVPGNCYFRVFYQDDDLLIPVIETLVFAGQDTHDEGRVWLFAEAGDPSIQWAVPDSQLSSILDFDGLARTVREVGTHHPLHPPPVTPAAAAADAEFADLAALIDRLLTDADCHSITMTVRFTDDALSLSRRESGFQIGFFTHPRFDGGQEERQLLELFGELGRPPIVDYLADRGRTRILGFELAADSHEIVALCRRVFLEVYGMRRGDVLDVQVLTRADVERMRAESASRDPQGPGEHGDRDGHP